MKEATARIKINKRLEAAGWRFFAEDGNLHYFWDLERGNPYVITSFPTPASVLGYRRVTPNPQRLIEEQVHDDYIALTQRPGYASEAAWKNEAERPATSRPINCASCAPISCKPSTPWVSTGLGGGNRHEPLHLPPDQAARHPRGGGQRFGRWSSSSSSSFWSSPSSSSVWPSLASFAPHRSEPEGTVEASRFCHKKHI